VAERGRAPAAATARHEECAQGRPRARK
jgi:hypothetical protein